MLSMLLLSVDIVYTTQKYIRKAYKRHQEQRIKRKESKKETKLNNQHSDSTSNSLYKNKKLNYW